MRRGKKYFVFLTLLVASLDLYSQESVPPAKADGKEPDRIIEFQKDRLSNFYLQKTGSPREYIDGKEYYPYYFRSKNNPVLRFEEERSGSLTIHGRTYDRFVLQYDTYTDEVIYTDDSLIFNNAVRQVALNKNNVSRFDLWFRHDTLHFRYFGKDRDTTFNLQDGFYEVVHDMKTRFLIKHASSAVMNIEKIKEYLYEPVSYIQVKDGFSRIKSRKQFIDLFGDRSEEISQFLRQKRIKIIRADKKQISDVLMYYEQLN